MLDLKLQTNRPVLTPILRTIRLQQRDHSIRFSLCFPSVAIMALLRNILQEDDVLCVLYANTRSDVSDYSDNKQLRYSTGPLTPHFPHPFFLTSIKTIFITV